MDEKNLTPEEMYEPELLTLLDGDGKEVSFEIVVELEHEGERYVGVVEYIEDPAQQSDEAQLVILHMGTDEEGDYYDVVDDGEELYQVGEKIRELLEDEYDIQG